MRNILCAGILLILTACGKSKEAQPEPQPAMLLLPAKDEACTNSVIISDTESKVNFKWEEAENAESYELQIKNLITGTFTSSELTITETEATLTRNTPYSWQVISKSGKASKVGKSVVRKFFNPGPNAITYTPFPAEVVSPLMASQIAFDAGKVSLKWTGSDADNDIEFYDIYFGTSKTPLLLAENLTDDFLNEIPVVSNTTYYWRIITKDKAGNTSDSGLFDFRVN